MQGQQYTITVHDFLIDFCHISYLRQITTSMGVLIGYASSNPNEDNLAKMNLLVESLDEPYFPPSIHVFHVGRVSICPITLVNQQSGGHDSPPPSPPPAQPNHRDNMEDIVQPHNQHSPPYIPPWRRNNMHMPLVEPDPGRTIGSVASLSHSTAWSTLITCVPDPRATPSPNGNISEGHHDPHTTQKNAN